MTEAIPTPRPRRASDAARSWSSVAASPGSPPLRNWRSAASTSRCTNIAQDERYGLDDEPAGTYPPVKLGGLAASQYSTVGPYTGSLAELRPFPGRRGHPRDPGRAVAGEHGFRFFPAYYIHTWDLFQRIPVYQRTDLGHGEVRWLPTSRTIMDNVRRVVTQGTTVEGKPSLVFPREAPRSPAEFLTTACQLTQLGFTPLDVQTFVSRLVDYLVTSPERRASELQNLSAYDFFVGRSGPDDPPRFSYSDQLQRRSAGDAPGTGGVRHALGRCPHQRLHLSSAPAANGSPRQQGRRGAQRPHHRIVVRPLVPPSRRARSPFRPR